MSSALVRRQGKSSFLRLPDYRVSGIGGRSSILIKSINKDDDDDLSIRKEPGQNTFDTYIVFATISNRLLFGRRSLGRIIRTRHGKWNKNNNNVIVFF